MMSVREVPQRQSTAIVTLLSFGKLSIQMPNCSKRPKRQIDGRERNAAGGELVCLSSWSGTLSDLSI